MSRKHDMLLSQEGTALDWKFVALCRFLVGEYFYDQMSSIKSRKHFLWADIGFSGVKSSLLDPRIILFCSRLVLLPLPSSSFHCSRSWSGGGSVINWPPGSGSLNKGSGFVSLSLLFYQWFKEFRKKLSILSNVMTNRTTVLLLLRYILLSMSQKMSIEDPDP
jgi:hypothetical protein